MPLILICGLPSSGKTYRAKQILEYFDERINRENNHSNIVTADTNSSTAAAASANSTDAITTTIKETFAASPENGATKPPKRRLKVHYISDHTLAIPRGVYLTSRLEKDARAKLYAAAKRVLTKDDIVILDSGNYIKGWRYQLHCEAKAASTPCCVVHVGTPLSQARQINDARNRPSEEASSSSSPLETNGAGEHDGYSAKTWEELSMRFEEPNAMARWDSPLFTVVWDDNAPPYDSIWEEMILGAHNKDGRRKIIKPNQATMLTPATKSDHLYELDRATQAVLASIVAYQRDHPDQIGGSVRIEVGEVGREKALILPASQFLPMAQLQRQRRQFIALHRQQMGGLGMGGIGAGGIGGADGKTAGLTAARVSELFVDWLNDSFQSDS